MSFRSVVAKLPPPLINAIARASFRIPVLGPWVRQNARKMAGEGVIQHGIGKGLRFDATGGNVGFVLGTTEPLEQSQLAKHLKVGGVFYDIGANVGFYSTLGANLVGSEGHVYAFEPFPPAVAMVRRNADLNQFSNVTVVEAAASGTSGTTRFEFTDEWEQNKIAGDVASTEAAEGLEVTLWSIDDFVEQTGARLPTVVMIDAEGAEKEILQGMQITLKKCRPVLMVEVHWLGEPMLVYFKEYIEPLGYTITTYEGTPLPSGNVRFHAIAIPNATVKR
jgi:FkbM family methyltransferase